MAAKGGEEEIRTSFMSDNISEHSNYSVGEVLLISVYEEARRTTSPLQVSYPPGKLHFSFTSSPTDIHNTCADCKAR